MLLDVFNITSQLDRNCKHPLRALTQVADPLFFHCLAPRTLHLPVEETASYPAGSSNAEQYRYPSAANSTRHLAMSHHYNSPYEGTGAGRQTQSPQIIKTGPSKKRSHRLSSGSEQETQDNKVLRVRTTDSKRRTSAEHVDTRKMSFACPFLKKDPLKFSGQNWRCNKLDLVRVRDVKQHLSRRHKRPAYCTRCSETFKSEKALEEHCRSQVACTLVYPPQEPDGTISKEIQDQLSQRPLSNQLKDHESQWFSMFETIFPNAPRPETPFDDDFQNFAAFRAFAMAEAPRILATFFPEVPEWNRPAFDQKISAGFQAVYSLWVQSNDTNVESSPTDCGPGLCSTVSTVDTPFSSPSSTIMAHQQSINFSLLPEARDAMVPPIQQDPVFESKAVQGARRETRKGLSSSTYATALSWDPEFDEFDHGVVPGEMWRLSGFDEPPANWTL